MPYGVKQATKFFLTCLSCNGGGTSAAGASRTCAPRAVEREDKKRSANEAASRITKSPTAVVNRFFLSFWRAGEKKVKYVLLLENIRASKKGEPEAGS